MRGRHTSARSLVSQNRFGKRLAGTDVSVDLLYETAATYATADAAFIGWTMGVNHSTKGTETVNAINNLALITGNIGRVGAAPFSITGQCNAMGTREAGGASSLPGYRTFESAAVKAVKHWQFAPVFDGRVKVRLDFSL